MKKFLLGIKKGMYEKITESGALVAVTVVEVTPSVVLELKTVDKHGYEAVKVGFLEKKAHRSNKPELGISKVVSRGAFSVIREFRVVDSSQYQVGQLLGVEVFAENEKVSVRSRTIGRGFTGTIKRWNFNRGPMSHGSKSHRIPGSIGAGTTPGRVVPGKKMGGRYGNERVVIRNLSVVSVDTDRGLLLLSGSVPGKKSNVLEVYQK